MRRPSGLAHSIEMLGTKGIHQNLGLQIPNLNLLISGGAQPVTVRREAEGVDDFSSVKGVEALALVQIPQHGGPIFSTRGAETSIR